MIITVASGKGGTGKTTLAVNLAHVLACGEETDDVRLLDCDVEEPDDHLFVKPTFTDSEDVTALRPEWDEEACTACGRCREACNYNAIALVPLKDGGKKVKVFPDLCHACGACSYTCPENALNDRPEAIGTVKADPASGRYYFAHGTLNVGEMMAPAVVKGVRRHENRDGVTIIDASPGTACPVVAAMEGADVALLVTEPTPFGLNDLRLAVKMALKMDIPAGIVVNRSEGEDAIIQDYADEAGVPVIGRIAFRRDYAEAYSRGEVLAERFTGMGENMMDIYRRARELAGTEVPPPPEEELLAEAALTDKSDEPGGGAGSDYSECTVISGKGGTGKTTVTAALAALADDKVMADCDVDAADLHLLLDPDIRECSDFYGGQEASINAEACTGCGSCAELCRFDAVAQADTDEHGEPETYRVKEFACEGCGLCALACPVDAVDMHGVCTGQSYVSGTDYGLLSHARLGIAEENSGRLVTRVRDRASDLAVEDAESRILGDGSPGTGCPVIASISGVDVALIVAEPTVSGVHDMERVLELCRHFSVRALICINKCDLNDEQAARIKEMASEADAPVIAEIPFDPQVNQALRQGKNLVEYGRGPAAEAVRSIWDRLRAELEQA